MARHWEFRVWERGRARARKVTMGPACHDRGDERLARAMHVLACEDVREGRADRVTEVRSVPCHCTETA